MTQTEIPRQTPTRQLLKIGTIMYSTMVNVPVNFYGDWVHSCIDNSHF